MQPHSFEGIFYLMAAPSIRYDDGLFFIGYDVGRVHIEFAMQPSVFIKTHNEAERAAKAFHERKESVTPLRRRKAAKPSH